MKDEPTLRAIDLRRLDGLVHTTLELDIATPRIHREDVESIDRLLRAYRALLPPPPPQEET